MMYGSTGPKSGSKSVSPLPPTTMFDYDEAMADAYISDETDPRTSENSVVLLHPGTEIYVAPRLRKPQSQSQGDSSSSSKAPALASTNSASRKGKEREKTVKMRLLPPRIASQWGRIPTPETELGELEKVIFTSKDSVERIRRKLEMAEEGPVYVRMTQAPTMKGDRSLPKEDAENGNAESGGEAQMEGWLVEWNQVPEGSCVVAGTAREGWSDWATVRYVPSVSHSFLRSRQSDSDTA